MAAAPALLNPTTSATQQTVVATNLVSGSSSFNLYNYSQSNLSQAIKVTVLYSSASTGLTGATEIPNGFSLTAGPGYYGSGYPFDLAPSSLPNSLSSTSQSLPSTYKSIVSPSADMTNLVGLGNASLFSSAVSSSFNINASSPIAATFNLAAPIGQYFACANGFVNLVAPYAWNPNTFSNDLQINQVFLNVLAGKGPYIGTNLAANKIASSSAQPIACGDARSPLVYSYNSAGGSNADSVVIDFLHPVNLSASQAITAASLTDANNSGTRTTSSVKGYSSRASIPMPWVNSVSGVTPFNVGLSMAYQAALSAFPNSSLSSNTDLIGLSNVGYLNSANFGAALVTASVPAAATNGTAPAAASALKVFSFAPTGWTYLDVFDATTGNLKAVSTNVLNQPALIDRAAPVITGISRKITNPNGTGVIIVNVNETISPASNSWPQWEMTTGNWHTYTPVMPATNLVTGSGRTLASDIASFGLTVLNGGYGVLASDSYNLTNGVGSLSSKDPSLANAIVFDIGYQQPYSIDQSTGVATVTGSYAGQLSSDTNYLNGSLLASAQYKILSSSAAYPADKSGNPIWTDNTGSGPSFSLPFPAAYSAPLSASFNSAWPVQNGSGLVDHILLLTNAPIGSTSYTKDATLGSMFKVYLNSQSSSNQWSSTINSVSVSSVTAAAGSTVLDLALAQPFNPKNLSGDYPQASCFSDSFNVCGGPFATVTYTPSGNSALVSAGGTTFAGVDNTNSEWLRDSYSYNSQTNTNNAVFTQGAANGMGQDLGIAGVKVSGLNLKSSGVNGLFTQTINGQLLNGSSSVAGALVRADIVNFTSGRAIPAGGITASFPALLSASQSYSNVAVTYGSGLSASNTLSTLLQTLDTYSFAGYQDSGSNAVPAYLNVTYPHSLSDKLQVNLTLDMPGTADRVYFGNLLPTMLSAAGNLPTAWNFSGTDYSSDTTATAKITINNSQAAMQTLAGPFYAATDTNGKFHLIVGSASAPSGSIVLVSARKPGFQTVTLPGGGFYQTAYPFVPLTFADSSLKNSLAYAPNAVTTGSVVSAQTTAVSNQTFDLSAIAKTTFANNNNTGWRLLPINGTLNQSTPANFDSSRFLTSVNPGDGTPGSFWYRDCQTAPSSDVNSSGVTTCLATANLPSTFLLQGNTIAVDVPASNGTATTTIKANSAKLGGLGLAFYGNGKAPTPIADNHGLTVNSGNVSYPAEVYYPVVASAASTVAVTTTPGWYLVSYQGTTNKTPDAFAASSNQTGGATVGVIIQASDTPDDSANVWINGDTANDSSMMLAPGKAYFMYVTGASATSTLLVK